MATIKIEIEFRDLQALIEERDSLRREIDHLRSRPIEFSLEWLAQRVENNWMAGRGYTPDQSGAIRQAILNCGDSIRK